MFLQNYISARMYVDENLIGMWETPHPFYHPFKGSSVGLTCQTLPKNICSVDSLSLEDCQKMVENSPHDKFLAITREQSKERLPEWTNAEVLHLIKEFRERRSLWDPDSLGYRNKSQRHQDWNDIAAIFNCNKLEVERKMNILTSQYRREKLKELKAKRCGLTYQSSWYGFKHFEFLSKRKPLRGASPKPSNKEPHQKNRKNKSVREIKFLPDLKTGQSEIDEEESESVAANEISLVNDVGERRDLCGCFGELVAHTLRKLPSDKIRCIVKNDINKILYEAELSGYGE